MSNYQPDTMTGLTRRTEKRLNSLERRANPSARIQAIENELEFYAGRNRIINGDLRINQRGCVSGQNLGVGAFGFDRWRNRSARGVDDNLVFNPSFEVDITGSTLVGSATIARSTTYASDGVACIAATSTAAASFGVSFGATGYFSQLPTALGTYTFSVDLRGTAALSSELRVRWYTAGGAAVGADVVQASTALSTSAFVRRSTTLVAPATATQVLFWVTATATGGGQIMYADAVKISESPAPVPYTDGSFRFTSSPQGQLVSFTEPKVQVIERANMEAGTYTISQLGTARLRVYNSGSTAPAFATAPFQVTLDGLADVVAEAESGTLGEVQLERGSVATTFERRPVGTELALCQRYYQRLANATADMVGIGNGAFWATTVLYVIIPLPVVMRSSPTASSSAVGGFTLLYNNNSATATVVAFIYANPQSVRMAVTMASTTTAGFSGWVQMAVGAYIEFNAEL